MGRRKRNKRPGLHLIIIIISPLYRSDMYRRHSVHTQTLAPYTLSIFGRKILKFLILFFFFFFLKERRWKKKCEYLRMEIDLVKEFFVCVLNHVAYILCVVIIITKKIGCGWKRRNLRPNHGRHVLFVVRHLVPLSVFFFSFRYLLNHDIIFSLLTTIAPNNNNNKMHFYSKPFFKIWNEMSREVNE